MKPLTEAADLPRPPASSQRPPVSTADDAASSVGFCAVDSGTSAAAAPPQGTCSCCGGTAAQHADHCLYSSKAEHSKPNASRGGGSGNGNSAPVLPLRQPGPSVAARLTRACQSTLIGRTLQSYGGIVQVVTEPAPPYRLVGVSGGWERLTGWERDEVVGRRWLDFLQGAATERGTVAALMQGVRTQQAISLRLTNYTKAGTSYVHQLTCEPLRAPSGATHCFQATSIVLRHPGEAEEAEVLAVGPMPLLGSVSPQHVPPLWRLLGGRPPPGFPALAPGAGAPQPHRPPLPPMDALLPPMGRAMTNMAVMFGAGDDLGAAGMGVGGDEGVGMGGSVPLQPLAMGNGGVRGGAAVGPSAPMLNDIDLISWCTSAPPRPHPLTPQPPSPESTTRSPAMSSSALAPPSRPRPPRNVAGWAATWRRAPASTFEP